MAGELVLVALAFAVGVLAYKLRPGAVRSLFGWITAVRMVVSGVFALIIAFALINSGESIAVVVGMLILVVVAWAVLIRRPDESVGDLTP